MSPTAASNPHVQHWVDALTQARSDIARCTTTVASGRLTRAVGLVLEATGLQLPVGSDCLIELPPGYPVRHAEAEVVGHQPGKGKYGGCGSDGGCGGDGGYSGYGGHGKYGKHESCGCYARRACCIG